MAFIDTQQLLEEISGSEPSGANLEYDAEFLTLERIALGKPEQQIGETIIAAEPPDYGAVLKQTLGLLGRTKDLRICVHLVRALLYRGGWQGFSEGLGLVHELLTRYWPTVHPQLDPDDGNDPTMRITAVAGLCTSEILGTLRTRPLITSRSFGPITLRDIMLAASAGSGDNGSSGEGGPKLDMTTIDAAFKDVDLPTLEASAQTIKDAAASLRGIEAVFESEAAGQGPELGPLLDLVRQAQHAVVSRLERRTNGETEEATLPTNGADGNGASVGHAIAAAPGITQRTGEIRSREDVVRALEKICAYYAEYEPSSPLPLLLQRCKRLVSKTFLEIVRDMAPDGVSQVETIVGRTED